MAELMPSSGLLTSANGQPTNPRAIAATVGRTSTSSPASSVKGPRQIMEARAIREAARQKAEAERLKQQEIQANHHAKLMEEERRKRAESLAAGDAEERSGRRRQESSEPRTPGESRIPQQSQQQQLQQQQQQQQQSSQVRQQARKPPAQESTAPTQQDPASRAAPQPQQAPPQQLNFTYGQDAPTGTQSSDQRPRNSFPHAFERWETLSAHWEGLASYWIRKLEQKKDEVDRDPVSQQLARQVTDLSTAGANLFSAIVELQRMRASSERKFQRWFFETRAELERAREVNAMLDQQLEKERQGRTEAIREALEQDQGMSGKAQLQLAEMRKELAISKEEARRAWEELGRREQEERDRTLSLQTGQPTIVGGVQVVPMTQGSSARPPAGYQTDPGFDQGRSAVPASGGAYGGGEFVKDAQGNFILDVHGNRIPYAAPPSTYAGSDVEAEDYDTAPTTNTPSGGFDTAATSGGGGGGAGAGPSGSGGDSQWTDQDYSGAGYGQPSWEVPRHHHPTRLSDVIEEEDERSRASTSAR